MLSFIAFSFSVCIIHSLSLSFFCSFYLYRIEIVLFALGPKNSLMCIWSWIQGDLVALFSISLEKFNMRNIINDIRISLTICSCSSDRTNERRKKNTRIYALFHFFFFAVSHGYGLCVFFLISLYYFRCFAVYFYFHSIFLFVCCASHRIASYRIKAYRVNLNV